MWAGQGDIFFSTFTFYTVCRVYSKSPFRENPFSDSYLTQWGVLRFTWLYNSSELDRSYIYVNVEHKCIYIYFCSHTPHYSIAHEKFSHMCTCELVLVCLYLQRDCVVRGVCSHAAHVVCLCVNVYVCVCSPPWQLEAASLYLSVCCAFHTSLSLSFAFSLFLSLSFSHTSTRIHTNTHHPNCLFLLINGFGAN